MTQVGLSHNAVARILVATDFSHAAGRAYAYALKLAWALGAEVDIVYVVRGLPALASKPATTSRSYVDHEKNRALAELGKMLRHAAEFGVKAQHRLLVGVPDASILEWVGDRGAGLIAMGTHGRTGWDRLQFGSTAESIVRQAPCPVLTVHAAVAGDLPMSVALRRLKLAHILVATDFAPDAQAALRFSASLAASVRCSVRLVHAYGEASVPIPAQRDRSATPVRHRSTLKLEKALAHLRESGLSADAVYRPGFAPDVILKAAQECSADLIVMGTRRSSALRRLVLGSVANAVIRRAGCPVLTVKHRRV